MSDKPSILIVDDSPQDIQMLLAELQGQYKITAATSADSALEILAEQDNPDLILLDVNMPGTNGYAACRKIKNSPELEEIEVIFLSANDSTEEIIEGLDAGAIDYIVKPYDPDILQSKIKTALELTDKRKQLLEQTSAANEMAYTVMAESGNLGQILGFFRNSFSLNTPKDLVEETSKALSGYELSNVVLLNTNSIHEISSSSGEPSMLEIELLERLVRYSEPFVEKGSRCFVIHNDIVVLIKNMPEDETKRGSLKDLIKLLLEGTQAKLQYFVDLQEASSAKLKTLSEVILEAKTALNEQHDFQQEHKRGSVLIMDEMVNKVENTFMFLGLTEEQENQLIEIMREYVNRLLTHVEAGLAMDERISEIVLKLTKAAKDAAS